MATHIFYTRHDGGLTMMVNGKQQTVSNTHPFFEQILSALKSRSWDEAIMLMNTEATINETGLSNKGTGKVFVRNGKVYFLDTRNHKEVELNGALVDRILRALEKPNCQKYADALMSLMENIQKNPVKEIAPELYEWLASGKAPITYDGCILAYKKIRSDFKDIYTGKMDNSPGKVVRVKQSEVDTDRRNECSRGLHFASLGYLSHYASSNSDSKVVIVKVNPRHIFAIPRDYNCQKGRASEYYVVGEYVSDKREQEEAFKDSFVNEDNLVESAPEVKFVKNGLRPSLEATAESYNLVHDGKVKIEVDTGKPIFWDQASDKNFIVKSFETKSVRKAVKEAVEKLESTG